MSSQLPDTLVKSHQLDESPMADLATRALNVLEAGEVVRFHAVPTIDGQTVGQHSYGVAAILIALGMMCDPDDRWVVSNAILHDTAEIHTGDMPFTVKRSSPEIKAVMDRLELAAEMDFLLVQTRLSPRQEVLLKLADMMEGLRWCLCGHERGNPIVAGRWAAAINSLFESSHHLFKPGEGERVWAVYKAIKEVGDKPHYAPHLYSTHSTLQSHLGIYANKPTTSNGIQTKQTNPA